MRNPSQTPRVGFTLVELLIVIAIIGLIVSLILVAAADGVRRAEERATQALITKLESALNDRLDALLNTQAPISAAHRYLAKINNGPAFGNNSDTRAQVIAQFDYLKSELPDVFFLNAATSDGGGVAGSYPLNFAAAPFHPTFATTDVRTNFVVPLGFGRDASGAVNSGAVTDIDYGFPPIDPISNTLIPSRVIPVRGMFGASFSAAGGLYKQLGYAPRGFDGVDNNGDGFIDELAVGEGVPTGTTLPAFQAQVGAQLSRHTHKTARAEMLYAILVEGLGPLGSAFNRDDFTNREVQDTDGDGLMEFVDSWGEPLQFYRWPIYYGTAAGSSDSQKASGPYTGFAETRQQDPLDPNQVLMSPGWWSAASNATLVPGNPSYSPPNGNSTNLCGQSSIAFMNYFHSLVDPQPSRSANSWDRTGYFNRRAYYSRFLILSGGPDKVPGVAQFNLDYGPLTPGTLLTGPSNIFPFPNGSATMEANALSLIYIENQAAQADPVNRQGSFFELPQASTATTVYLQVDASLDDISNHNVSAPSTGVR